MGTTPAQSAEICGTLDTRDKILEQAVVQFALQPKILQSLLLHVTHGDTLRLSSLTHTPRAGSVTVRRRLCCRSYACQQIWQAVESIPPWWNSDGEM